MKNDDDVIEWALERYCFTNYWTTGLFFTLDVGLRPLQTS
jgi:hypothetical protein